MKIKVENGESEDNHVSMVEKQEGIEDIEEFVIKEEVTEVLTDNELEKSFDSQSFNVNEGRIKIEKVESEDYSGTMVEIQEETEDLKVNFFNEEVTEDLTDNELEKSFDNKSFNVNEGRIKIEKVKSEDYSETMVEIQEETEDIKEYFFKEEFNEDLANNELEKSSDSKSFNDNRARNEANKITHACYFKSRIVTDNNKETASKYNNEDISKHRVFQCDLCQKMYKTKKQITVHILKSHKSSTDKHCTQKLNTIHSNKFTKTYTNINRHFKCDVCFKHFAKNSYLRKHLRSHSSKNPHKCNVCYKSFSNKTALTTHTRVHTGKKSYECIVCYKSFSQKSYLEKHQHVHTGEKPCKCDICPKSFSFQTSLKKHLLVHAGEWWEH